MHSPAVSIIIPTYRHRDFILATLDSVFAQSFTDYEIIVINDGSPDDTATLLAPLTQRVHYIEQRNQGQAAARNRGLAEARGEFIALLDDDDLWPPGRLAAQVVALRDNPAAVMVAGLAELFDATGAPARHTRYQPVVDFRSLLEINPIISPGQTLIRASALKQVGGLNPDIWGADDWDLWLRLSRCGPILTQNAVALRYRIHAANASHQRGRMLKNAVRVLDLWLKEVQPPDRHHTRRAAYRGLFDRSALAVIHQAKTDIKAGRISNALKQSLSLSCLKWAVLRDPWLLRRFAQELLPRALSPQGKVP